MGIRKRIFDILELANTDDKTSRYIDRFLITLIILNVLAVILESVNSIYIAYTNILIYFELFSVAIFTVEYFLRIWCCVDHPEGKFQHGIKGRLRFTITPMALIDLAAILPFYLSMILMIDLRFLRVLRMLRLFKLTRYSTAMNLLLTVLKDEAKNFGAAFFILFIILIVAANGIYLLEFKAQPEAYSSVPASIWWAVATLTTVGYGDITPITTGGKIFGAILMIVGIGMVALPAGILASAFSEQLRKRRKIYENLVDTAMEDGQVTSEEISNLEQVRIQLDLDPDEARNIYAKQAREHLINTAKCPHCLKLLNHND